MILADTSIWADHFRRRDKVLEAMLDQDLVLMHPLIVGELALGFLRPRASTLAALLAMQPVLVATHSETLSMIETESLMGCGIGYIDVHLLASAKLTSDTQLWTRDRRLAALAVRMGVSIDPA